MPRSRIEKRRKVDKRARWHKNRQEKPQDKRTPDSDIADSLVRIHEISSMSLGEFPALMEELALEKNTMLQEPALRLCLKRILNCMDPTVEAREPHFEQVRILRRLIFFKGDSLLIARTGFGKSIIFHAFSILTGKITLQIIPLNKLGEEQMDDISQVPGTRPCVITHETRAEDKDLIPRIIDGLYTHILLGPEQASSKEFRDALKSPELQNRVGLVAIDECHLISEWETFRPAFTMLGELRMVLHRDVVWFGCSASLPEKAEQIVIQQAGFRRIGQGEYETEVIRTTIDRQDIAIGVFPIPRGMLSSFDIFYFLLDDSADCTGVATPNRIPKTIIFIDNRTAVQEAALYLQMALIAKTTNSTHQKYSVSSATREYCVSKVVDEYTARVAKYDRQQRYKEFKKPDSATRIMVATTSLGMGVNVPDVERTVLWGFPPSNDPGDHWQKIGRGGRGPGRRSKGYIFLPYWAFDSEGINPPQVVPEKSSTTAKVHGSENRQRRTGHRNMTPSNRIVLRSINSPADTTMSDISDVQSVASQDFTPSATGGATTRREWTKTERAKRAELPQMWREVVNAPCHRRAFLQYLGEFKLPEIVRGTPVPPHQCCSRCDPSLFPPRTPAPEVPPPISQPKPKTRGWVALQYIDAWMTEMAKARYGPNCRFPMTACAFMHREIRWQLAHLYGGRERVWGSMTLESLHEQVPKLTNWIYRDSHERALLEQLQSIEPKVNEEYAKILDEKRRSKNTQSIGAKSQVTNPIEGARSISEYRENIRRMDDNLAVRLAKRNIEQRTFSFQPLVATSSRPSAATPTRPLVSTPPQPPAATPLRHCISALVASPEVHQIPDALANAPESVRKCAEKLTNIRRKCGSVTSPALDKGV